MHTSEINKEVRWLGSGAQTSVCINFLWVGVGVKILMAGPISKVSHSVGLGQG